MHADEFEKAELKAGEGVEYQDDMVSSRDACGAQRASRSQEHHVTADDEATTENTVSVMTGRSVKVRGEKFYIVDEDDKTTKVSGDDRDAHGAARVAVESVSLAECDAVVATGHDYVWRHRGAVDER